MFRGARGYVATIVAGEVIMENGRYTGAVPGRLIRGSQVAGHCLRVTGGSATSPRRAGEPRVAGRRAAHGLVPNGISISNSRPKGFQADQ